MIIVAGHLIVDPDQRDAYLAGCEEVVRQARGTEGCLDFCLSPDLIDPGRINILERWTSRERVESFRGDGPDAEQQTMIRAASVAEYDVEDSRQL